MRLLNRGAFATANYRSFIKNNNKTTQTELDFSIQLNDTKHARIYYSKAYKDYVLSFNINSTKSFIITRDMWKVFKLNIFLIDAILN